MQDLISRQAAIDALYHVDEYNGRSIEAIRNLPSAQPERLTDDDFETIRIHLNAYKEKLCNQQRWEEADEYQRIIDRFMAFAPAQPEPQWIPCSERLPEPRMAVLGYAPRYRNIYALYYDTVLGWMVWSPVNDTCFPESQGEIVAWMPLPEIYRGDEDGE